ncbi:penicillin-binding protein 2 [Thermodesulfobacteriota bacterium]
MTSTGFDPVSIEVLNRRLKFVTLLVIAVFSVLILRLWHLQVVKGLNYRVQSENNRISLQDIPPFRGMIFDRNGELLVDNRPSYDLYVIPEEIQDRLQLFETLKMLLGFDLEKVLGNMKTRYRKYPFKPILVKKNMSRNELAVIETNRFNLPGVMIQVKPQRHYIHGTLASHLIGYLGEISESQLNGGSYPDNKAGDLIGKYGVEGKWEKYLKGSRGGEQVEVDAAGRKLKLISRKAPRPGLNLALSIDRNLQSIAEKGLENKKGAVVAINPKNGEILAMASRPGFDPNLFVGRIDRAEWRKMTTNRDFPLQDRSISGQYPPGSVFKIVVSLAGLEEGVIDPDEEIFCNGRYQFGNRAYGCWKKGGHGRVAFHRGLKESCDVYFYKIGRRLGVDRIAHYAKLCGLGKKTGFHSDIEKGGLIPSTQWKLKRWKVPWQPGETLSTAIGQGFVLVTPLQMARLTAAIFNGGNLFQPKVIQWIGKNGRRVHRFKPSLSGKLGAKPENLELIKNALIGVVNEPHGTGSRARIRGLAVAGKTGTAQVVSLETEKAISGGNEIPVQFRDHAWFVAIAPAESPLLALAILVENGGHGGSAAAPIAKKMIKAYLMDSPKVHQQAESG